LARRTWAEGEFNPDGSRVELKDRLDGWRAELDEDEEPEVSPVGLLKSTVMWMVILGVATPLLAAGTFIPYFGWIPGLAYLWLPALFGFSRADLAFIRVRGIWWKEVLATALVLGEVALILYFVRPGLALLVIGVWCVGFYVGTWYYSGR
jgi:hypothetical protein